MNSGTKKSRNASAKHLEHYENRVEVVKNITDYLHGRLDLYDEFKDVDMEDHELIWFIDRFTPMYEAQCKKNEARGQGKRNKPIEEYMQAKIDKHTKETVFQVGNMFDNLGREHMQAIYFRFRDKREEYNKAHGITFKVMDAVMHTEEDEATPHIHERGVFITKDENGNDVPEIEKALQEAGIPIAYPNRPPKNRKEAQFNNRAITYTNEMRELFLTTAREYVKEKGLNVDLEDIKYTDPEAKEKIRHKSVREYTMEQMRKTADLLEEAQKKYDMADKLLDIAGEKRREERLEKLQRMKADREKQETHNRIFGND